MRTLVFYDNTGYIISLKNGIPSPKEPIGVPFLWVDIPEGKKIKVDEEGIGVDVSVTPHQVILEDIPKSETQLLNERLEATEQALLQIMLEGML